MTIMIRFKPTFCLHASCRFKEASKNFYMYLEFLVTSKKQNIGLHLIIIVVIVDHSFAIDRLQRNNGGSLLQSTSFTN